MATEHDIASAHGGPFGLRVDTFDRTHRVILRGEFDLAAVAHVEEALEPAYAGAAELLEIDLGALTFLDSSGLRTILQAHARASSCGVALRLLRGPETVQRVFAITGLEQTLPFADEPCN